MKSIAQILSGRWRYVAYGAFVFLRLWAMRQDELMPIWDAADYTIKAAWMAEAPLARAMPAQAFSFLPLRPPGAAWLALPFLAWRPSLGALAFAFFAWCVAFIEIGVRGIVPGRYARARDSAAMVLLFGNASFFVGMETFFVDHIFAAQTVAAIGLAIAWIRRPSARMALGAGLCAALAIWTKPVGIVALAALGAGMALCGTWKQIAWSGGLSAVKSRRATLHTLAFLAPAAIALATLFFTDYRQAWEAFHPARQAAWKPELRSAFPLVDCVLSVKSFGQILYFVVTGIGGAPALCFAAVTAFVLARPRPNGRARQRLVAPTLAPAFVPLVAALAWFVFLALLPVRYPRYAAPLVAAVLMLVVAVVVRRGPGARRALAWCAAVALAWRAGWCVLAVSDDRAGAGQSLFFPMRQMREVLTAIERRKPLVAPDGPAVVVATNAAWEVEALWTAQRARELGIEWIPRDMGLRSQCRTYAPAFPHFSLDPLPQLPLADFLVCTAPTSETLTPGTEIADWIALNDYLWQPGHARKANWTPAFRSASVVLYQTPPEQLESSPAELARSRYRALENVAWQSDGAAVAMRAMRTARALRRFLPPGRRSPILEHGEFRGGILLHAEYPGNPLPHGAVLDIAPGDEILCHARAADTGDGMVLRFSVSSDDGVTSATSLRLERGERRAIPASALGIGRDAATKPAALRVLPGPAQNAANDCFALVIR